MEYREAKCPRCGGVLQVPKDLEKLTCMYCGRTILAKDMILGKKSDNDNLQEQEEVLLQLWKDSKESAIIKAEDFLKKDPFHSEANYILALDSLPRLITEHKYLLNQFKKNLYEKAMLDYIKSSRPTLIYVERACIGKQDRSTYLTECAKYFIHRISEDLGTQTDQKNSKTSYIIDNYKMLLALFTIPMILELDLDISDEFADKIIESWINKYPKSPIKKGNFEEINTGFSRKGFCYITTAVCETLNKPDDCYELMMFRGFRDKYLLTQEDGQGLVEEYYHIAPLIVRNINSLENKDNIYKDIWNDYLRKCLKAIESGDNARCKSEYMRMVIELKKQYC